MCLGIGKLIRLIKINNRRYIKVKDDIYIYSIIYSIDRIT